MSEDLDLKLPLLQIYCSNRVAGRNENHPYELILNQQFLCEYQFIICNHFDKKVILKDLNHQECQN
jgi:hypothetical protein